MAAVRAKDGPTSKTCLSGERLDFFQRNGRFMSGYALRGTSGPVSMRTRHVRSSIKATLRHLPYNSVPCRMLESWTLELEFSVYAPRFVRQAPRCRVRPTRETGFSPPVLPPFRTLLNILRRPDLPMEIAEPTPCFVWSWAVSYVSRENQNWCADVAQLAEHLICNQAVASSSLAVSSAVGVFTLCSIGLIT